MANVLDVGVRNEGFLNTERSTIYTIIANKLRASFGAQFDVSPESPDGQIIGAVADIAKQVLDVCEEGYNSYNPSAAYGIGLDQVVKLNYIERFVNTFTKVTVELAGENGTIVPEGALVLDIAGYEYAVKEQVFLPSSVTAICTTPGPINVSAHEITTIKPGHEVNGWTGVDNLEAGYPGVTYEEDPVLRSRRDNSTIIAGTGPIDAIYEALRFQGLKFVTVVDNDSDVAVNVQPPATIQVIVEGGTASEIAGAIFRTKGAGIRTYGTISQTIKDRNGYDKVIKFSRPSAAEIFMEIGIKRLKGSSNESEDQVRTAAMNYVNEAKIGQTIIWSELLSYIVENTDLISIRDLQIGRSAGTLLPDDVVVTPYEKPKATIAGVIINVLP